MTFNVTTGFLIKHDHAQPVSSNKYLDLLQVSYDQTLIQFGPNIREKVNFICNRCGCYCESIIAARRFCILHPVHTTNFLSKIQEDAYRLWLVHQRLSGGDYEPCFGQQSTQVANKKSPIA